MKLSCAKCFKLVGVPTRLKIFEQLKKKGKKTTVNDLVELTSLRQPTVTFHLNQLEKVGIVKRKKSGRTVYCEARRPCGNCPLF
jgi:DNA-binding transcriptional ArsR family regulator